MHERIISTRKLAQLMHLCSAMLWSIVWANVSVAGTELLSTRRMLLHGKVKQLARIGQDVMSECTSGLAAFRAPSFVFVFEHVLLPLPNRRKNVCHMKPTWQRRQFIIGALKAIGGSRSAGH